MSAAPTDVLPSGASTRGATDQFLAALRDEQCDYLDAVYEAAAMLRGHGQLEETTASIVQLTRQFFDAQRAIIGRVGQHEVALRDTGVAPHDVLEYRAWYPVLVARQLSDLLDSWWADVNDAATRTLDAAIGRSWLHGGAPLATGQPSTNAGPAAPTPTPDGSRLPASIREVLDHADGDLRILLASLRATLDVAAGSDRSLPPPVAVPATSIGATRSAAPDAPPAPPATGRSPASGPLVTPALPSVPTPPPPTLVAPPALDAPRTPPPAAPAVASVVPSAALVAVGAPRPTSTSTELVLVRSAAVEVHSGDGGVDHHLADLERLDQSRREFWHDPDERAVRFPTQAVASIAVATAALVAVMAWIG